MKWRTVLVLVALVALGVLVYFNRDDFVQAFELFKTANWLILALVPLIQLASFYSNARYYQTFFETFDYHPKLPRLYKLSLAINFVNQILPSAGISAITFLSYGLKDEVPSGKVTLAQYGRYVLTYISYSVIIGLGLLALYFGGGIDKITIRIVIILVASTLLASVLMILVLNRQRFDAVAYWLRRTVDRLARPFRRGKGPLIGKKRMRHLLNEFHEGYDLIKAERRHLYKPFWYSLLGNIMEVLTLYVVFLALHIHINIGAVILAYAVANAVAVVSIVPGDVGLYEIAMVATLSSTGVPVAIGLGATLLYRILNKALFLPIGFYYYSKFLNGKKDIIQPEIEAKN